MTDLPRELQAWAEPLQLFGEDVHDGIGRWLLPLRSIVGPMSVPRSAAHGDPDGYDGLTRRGSYDRLLLSEWAVALEIPEEFLRRAVMKEHVFLAPAYVEPYGASTCVALLDAGPLQLGAPRLVHLAALIVLHQRAQDCGAAFRFGVLQDERTALSELTRPAIPAWIKARSWAHARSGVGAWTVALETEAPEDLWFVGDGSLLSAANRLGAGLLEVQELPDDPHRMRVQAHRRGAMGGSVELALPLPDDAIRIFRRPLASPRRRKLDVGEVSTAVGGQLSRDGRRLFVGRTDGGIDAVHVPNSHADRQGRAKRVLPAFDWTLVAADQFGRRLIALDVDGGGQLMVRGAGFGDYDDRSAANSIGNVFETGLDVPESLVLSEPEADRLVTMHVTMAHDTAFEAWILGLNGELWTLSLRAKEAPALTIRDRACLRLCRLRSDLVAWVSGSAETVLCTHGRAHEDLVLTEEELATVSFGPPYWKGIAFAYQRGAELTRVVNHPIGEFWERPTGPGAVIGFSGRLPSDEPRFFTLDPDRKTVRRDGASLFTSPTRLTEVVHEPCCGRIAARSEQGTIYVYGIERESVLLCLERAEGGAS